MKIFPQPPRRVVCRGDVHLLRWDEHVNGAAKTRRLQVEAAIVHAYVTRMSEMQGATSYCGLRLRLTVLRADRVRQLLPWQHGPVARCGAGWRGQHEDNWKIFLWRLPAQRNRFGRSSIEKAR